MEMLENTNVLVKLLILAVPTVGAMMVAMGYIFAEKRKLEFSDSRMDANALASGAYLLLSVCATNFMYTVVEVLLILFPKQISEDRILGETIYIFLVIGLLNAISCLVKGIIGGKSMKKITGRDRKLYLNKALIFMAIAEVPSLIALLIYLVKFFLK